MYLLIEVMSSGVTTYTNALQYRLLTYHKMYCALNTRDFKT